MRVNHNIYNADGDFCENVTEEFDQFDPDGYNGVDCVIESVKDWGDGIIDDITDNWENGVQTVNVSYIDKDGAEIRERHTFEVILE